MVYRSLSLLKLKAAWSMSHLVKSLYKISLHVIHVFVNKMFLLEKHLSKTVLKSVYV